MSFERVLPIVLHPQGQMAHDTTTPDLCFFARCGHCTLLTTLPVRNVGNQGGTRADWTHVYLAVLPALPLHAQADEAAIASDLRCHKILSGWVFSWLDTIVATKSCMAASRHVNVVRGQGYLCSCRRPHAERSMSAA